MIKVDEAYAAGLSFDRYRKTSLAEAIEMPEAFVVTTKEGEMTGKPGDYLMRGPAGEMYPCDAEIFLNTYTHADPDKLAAHTAEEIIRVHEDAHRG